MYPTIKFNLLYSKKNEYPNKKLTLQSNHVNRIIYNRSSKRALPHFPKINLAPLRTQRTAQSYRGQRTGRARRRADFYEAARKP